MWGPQRWTGRPAGVVVGGIHIRMARYRKGTWQRRIYGLELKGKWAAFEHRRSSCASVRFLERRGRRCVANGIAADHHVRRVSLLGLDPAPVSCLFLDRRWCFWTIRSRSRWEMSACSCASAASGSFTPREMRAKYPKPRAWMTAHACQDGGAHRWPG